MSLAPLLAALAAAAPDAAATPVAAVAPPPAASAQQGAISYPPEFFAAAQPVTAMDMLDRLPGFQFDGGDDVRGFGGAAGNVLIDGERPASKSDGLESIVRRVPASQVERIDLIRGGAPGIDMQGKTVLVNIVRKHGASVTGLISVVNSISYDKRNAPGLRLEATRRDGERSMEGSFVVSGYIDDGDGDGPRVRRDATGAPILVSHFNTEGDGTQAVATGAYASPLAGGKFRINAQLFHDKYEEDIDDTYLSQAGFQTERDSSSRNKVELGLRWSRNLSPKLALETTGLQTVQKVKFYDLYKTTGETDYFTDDHMTGETVGRAVLRYHASDTLALEAGGEVAYNWLKSDTDLTVNGAAIDLPSAHVKVTEARGEAFFTATWKPVPTINVEGGITYEASKITSTGDSNLEKSLGFPKPRLAVTWSPDPKDQFRLHIEREVSQLDFGDFIASTNPTGGGIHSGNPDLNPQQDWLYEAVYERRFWESGSLSFTYRHFDYQDVIDRKPIYLPLPVCTTAPCPVVDPNDYIFDAPGNIGTGKRDALIVSLNLPLDRLYVKGGRLKLDSWIRRSEVTDPTTGEKRPQSGMHPVDWEAHFTQDLPIHHLTWGVDAYGGWRERYYRYNEVETVKLRTYVTPFLEYKPRKDIAVRLEIQNATERGFERIRQPYDGPRGAPGVQLAYTDTRELGFGRIFYLRVRKTFG